MFTGIVYSARPINDIEHDGSLGKISIDLGDELCKRLSVGASICVDGVCVTVTAIKDTNVFFDVIWTTLNRTALPHYSIGRLVNIERSLGQGEEIGGHEVSGHIDCTGKVSLVEKTGNNTCVSIDLDARWMRYLFPHGFVAVNGVSLTVSDVDKERSRFSVWLIPETCRRTNLPLLSPGDLVNIEIHRGVQVLVDTLDDAVERAISKAISEGKISGDQINSLVASTRLLFQGRAIPTNKDGEGS